MGFFTRLLVVVIIILRHQGSEFVSQFLQEATASGLTLGLLGFGFTLGSGVYGLDGTLGTVKDGGALITVELDTGHTVLNLLGSLGQQREYLNVLHAVNIVGKDIERRGILAHAHLDFDGLGKLLLQATQVGASADEDDALDFVGRYLGIGELLVDVGDDLPRDDKK